MGRGRTLLWAFAVSMVVHLYLLGSFGSIFGVPEQELVFPIEASLVEPEPAAPVSPSSSPKPAPPKPHSPPRPSPVAPAVTQEGPISERDMSAVEGAALATVAPEPRHEPPEQDVGGSVAPSEVEQGIKPENETPVRPVVRTLPEDMVIRYSVQTGEGEQGFVAGRATYIWHSGQGRYSLVSTVEATGLASLFISGRIVQVSEGELDREGLRPRQYWLQRNARKQDAARFLWETQQLVHGDKPGVSLKPQSQDLLSFPFFLAMTARESEADFRVGVTNGRKFNEYGFSVQGREILDIGGRRFDALHLHGAKRGEGEMDVWLDLARNGLPVRVRTVDRKNKIMELRLEDVSEGNGRSGGQP